MELVKSQLKASVKASAGKRESILLMPIGDIQAGTPDCDLNRIREHIQWGVDHGAYFLGMGDYVDFASPSNRARLQTAGLYDSGQLALDDIASQHALDMYEKVFKPSKGRWLGLLQGHHYWTFMNGETTDTLLAQWLGAPFLGDCAIAGIEFPGQGVCEIWCHHGSGAGQLLSSPLNQLQRVSQAFQAHIYLVAHQHKLVGGRPERLFVNWKGGGRLMHQSLLLACTGSFMRGYTQNRELREGHPEGSYVEKKMLTPVALGGLLIEIKPRVVNGVFVPDMFVSM